MKQIYFIGVDISKNKVDTVLVNSQFEILSEDLVFNSDLKLEHFLKTIVKRHRIDPFSLLICCETTGIYSSPLKRVCKKLGVGLWVEHAIKIKRASTDMRGKTDRKDALRIAEYALRYQDRAILYEASSSIVTALQHQVKIRETLIDKKVSIENQLSEAKSHDKELYKDLAVGYKAVLKSLRASIQKTEAKIEELSQQEESIKKNIELLRSIPGVGLQNALQFIIRTDNFKNFGSAKQLACYAGVVPFANESGTIVKKSRVSPMANQTLKQLLHMAAMCAIRAKGELKEYYMRKVAEGKNKMSALNAVRNKLIHRMFAVIQRQTPYEPQRSFSIKPENQLVL
jgi:transposase